MRRSCSRLLTGEPPQAFSSSPYRSLASAGPASSPRNGRLPVPMPAYSSAAPPIRPFRTTAGCRGAPGTRPGGLSGLGASESEADLGRHFYLNKVLETWAAKPATRMTLRQLIFFGKTLGKDREKILKSAAYVRQELPLRIAHRIRDLQALPFVVMTNSHLEDVYNKYWSAFETLRRLPPIKDMDDNERFCSLLKRLLDDHLTIIPSLTIGIVESSHHLPPQQLDKFMERMLRSRISRRVLAEQHLALSEALDDPFHFFNEPVRRNDDEDPNDESLGGNHVGIIYTHLSVASVVRKGAKLLTEVFASAEGIAADRVPEIQIDGDLNARFAYIPEHLEYIVFELLKNAIRATIRQHAGKDDAGVVRVTIVEGPPQEDLIIRISDSGGGLPDLIEQLSIAGPSAYSASDLQYPIPFPETGPVGGYAGPIQPLTSSPTASTSSMAQIPVAHSHSSLNGNPGVPASWASSPPTPTWVPRGGVGSAGGVAGTETGHDGLSAPFPSSLPGSSPSSPLYPISGASPALSSDSLIDALCSFSNVRRRLELEEEAARRAAALIASGSTASSTSAPNESLSGPSEPASASQADSDANMEGSTDPSARSDTTVPTPTRDQFHALRSVRRFKGTVTEQVSTSPLDRPSASTLSTLSPDLSPLSQAIPHAKRAYEGTGPAALHTVQVETGLGLPMAKVYCDFFGGSLSLRSLDGHSTDVYVRLPKLGTNKERIEEIVL